MSDATLILLLGLIAVVCPLAPLVLSHYFLGERGESA